MATVSKVKKQSVITLIVSLQDCLDYLFGKDIDQLDKEVYELFIKESVDFIFNNPGYCSQYHMSLYLVLMNKNISQGTPPWESIKKVVSDQFLIFQALLVEKFKNYKLLKLVRKNKDKLQYEIKHQGEVSVVLKIPKELI